MWLTGRLAPDFKTIADFRRDNGAGIRNVCRRFVVLCRELKLFSQAVVAIDGSKFKAVNSRDRNFTPGKIDERQQQIEAEHPALPGRAGDRRPHAAGRDRGQDRAAAGQDQDAARADAPNWTASRTQLKHEPDGQLSLTDPDARSMISQAKGTGMVGYNVQTAVDAKHHLIVAHEVTNVGNDRAQLSKMALAAREAMGKKKLQALADRGYFNGPEIKACDDAGITTYRAQADDLERQGRGALRQERLHLHRQGRRVPVPCRRARDLPVSHARRTACRCARYWSSACPQCPMKAQCTPSDYRRIRAGSTRRCSRPMQRRLDRKPDAMTLRQTHHRARLRNAEALDGFDALPDATARATSSTEMSLHVLAYNLKRVISILGIAKTMKAMKLVGA